MVFRHAIFATSIGFLLSLFVLSPARAATVIYYSAQDDAYGWCAGYATATAHNCAHSYCDTRGKGCEFALECAGGWGAIARAERPSVGFAASCGLGDIFSGRAAALTQCFVVTGALCWTDSTFNVNGNESAASANKTFDLTYYAQLLLQLRGYKPGSADGNPGPDTRKAVTEFQANLGLPQTGVIDRPLVDRLLDAAGGSQRLATLVKRDIIDKREAQFANRVFVQSRSPAPSLSFGEELMRRTEADRRMALATILSASKTKCTLPAVDAQPIGNPADGVWSVVCREGSYTLFSSDGSNLIVAGGAGAGNAAPPSGQKQPEPSSAATKQEPKPAATPPKATAKVGSDGLTDTQRDVRDALLANAITDPSGTFRFEKGITSVTSGIATVRFPFSAARGSGNIAYTFTDPDNIARYFRGGTASGYFTDATDKMKGSVTMRDEADSDRKVTWHLASRAVADNAAEIVWVATGDEDVLIVVTIGHGTADALTKDAKNVPILPAIHDDALAAARIAYDHLDDARLDATLNSLIDLFAPK